MRMARNRGNNCGLGVELTFAKTNSMPDRYESELIPVA